MLLEAIKTISSYGDEDTYKYNCIFLKELQLEAKFIKNNFTDIVIYKQLEAFKSCSCIFLRYLQTGMEMNTRVEGRPVWR